MAGQLFRPSDFLFLDSDGEWVFEDPRERNQGIRFYMVPPRPRVVDEHTRNRSAAICASTEFVHLYCEIKEDRDLLIQAFPRLVHFPAVRLDAKLKWCVFCLGSRLCARIYNERYRKPVKAIDGHKPLLSLVVHLDQDALLMLINYLHEWFLIIGMEQSLGAWLYAVLACLRLPLTEGFGVTPLATFYHDCEERLKFCSNQSERLRLYQFSAIFDVHFKNHLN